MRGFIDDKNSTVNRFEDAYQSHSALLPLVQHYAQLWNDLLECSGGALEASGKSIHTRRKGILQALSKEPSQDSNTN
jgi:hypothetical protein